MSKRQHWEGSPRIDGFLTSVMEGKSALPVVEAEMRLSMDPYATHLSVARPTYDGIDHDLRILRAYVGPHVMRVPFLRSVTVLFRQKPMTLLPHTCGVALRRSLGDDEEARMAFARFLDTTFGFTPEFHGTGRTASA